MGNKRKLNIDVLKPDVKLLTKLAAIVVYAEETSSEAALTDPDVQAWIDGMRQLTLIP